MKNVRPLEDRVLVRLIPEEEQTKGGIIKPAIARDGSYTVCAVVVSMGEGDRFKVKRREDGTGKPVLVERKERRPMDVNVGDEVICRWSTSTEFIEDGAKFCFVHEEDSVLMVLEQSAA